MRVVFIKPLPTNKNGFYVGSNKEFNELFSLGTVFETIAIKDNQDFKIGLKVSGVFQEEYRECGGFPLYDNEFKTCFKILE